ncbi:MAG: response regulator [Deltaproteobacteria bacterium]|jgi:signal transduction histidine kinase/HPt (histidine-containing phosphotransfer) domain-containing protein/ActR/RegA family two-component response regulator|nr:response regulator [Deltaproteobacteria bacterium]
MEWKNLIKANAVKLTMVFGAFLLMAAMSYLSLGSVVNRNILQNMEESMVSTEAFIRLGFAEPEAVLTMAAYQVGILLEGPGASEAVAAFLKETTRLMRDRSQWLLGFNGIYGYIDGEIINSMGYHPGEDFVPETRPWFDTAVRAKDGRNSYTEPYVDQEKGSLVISIVRPVADRGGAPRGFLVVDVDMAFFQAYMDTLPLPSGTYGVIMNADKLVLGHPDHRHLGKLFRDVSEGYRWIYERLLEGQNVTAVRFREQNGMAAIASVKGMYNGWYVALVTPYWTYYRDVYVMLGVLCLLGLSCAAFLSYLLLRLYRDQLRSERENQTKSTFLARMSHEIRTPLSAIIGLSELVQREYGKPKGAEYITGIRNSGEILLGIIDEILDFSKIQTGQLSIVSTPYNTASAINDLLTIIRVKLAETSLEFHVDISPELPTVLIGDAVRIRQILINLLSNSIKYTKEGYIRLTASAEPTGDHTVKLSFRVEDSGIGIKAEDFPKLFREFIRVDAQRNPSIEGTGLGLPIAKSLCEAMGGEILVESEYGKGSVFTAVVIQIVFDWEPMGEFRPGSAGPGRKQKATFTAPRAKVLVVDDFASNILVAEGLLQPYRFGVATCMNGREAVELVRGGSFDLVLMDHMMPEMDGIEAVMEIKAMEGGAFANLPVIVLTANAVSGMRKKFLDSGFSDFLSKPIDVYKLDEVLRKWLPADLLEGPPPDAPGAASEGPSEAAQPLPKIEGLDAEAGIQRTGGSRGRWLDCLGVFLRDMRERVSILDAVHDRDNLQDFTILVHALKSSLSNIGADGLSSRSAELEAAGHAGDLETVRDKVDDYRRDLNILAVRVKELLATSRPGRRDGGVGPEFFRLLGTLRAALDNFDVSGTDSALERLKSLPLAPKKHEAVIEIADMVLSGDYQEAMDAVIRLESGNAPPAQESLEQPVDAGGA